MKNILFFLVGLSIPFVLFWEFTEPVAQEKTADITVVGCASQALLKNALATNKTVAEIDCELSTTEQKHDLHNYYARYIIQSVGAIPTHYK